LVILFVALTTCSFVDICGHLNRVFGMRHLHKARMGSSMIDVLDGLLGCPNVQYGG
jgi:hypothetical protein